MDNVGVVQRIYPEPRWLGMIQHDKVLFDQGTPAGAHQSLNADIDIEYQLASSQWHASAQLALTLLNSNRLFATEYPATVSNAMSNTDSNAFMKAVGAVSVRENRRPYEMGQGSDPHWHRSSDVFATYSGRTSGLASMRCGPPWRRFCSSRGLSSLANRTCSST